MNLSDLRTAVRSLVGDSLREDPDSPGTYLDGPTVWTNTEIKDAINLAIRDYCEKTGCTTTSTTVAHGSQLPATSYGADSIRRAIYSNSELLRSSVDHEARINSSWVANATGTPTRFCTSQGYFFMAPGGSSKSATVYHLAVPTALSGDSDTPDSRIPDGHHFPLVYLAAAHLLMQGRSEGSVQKAASLQQAFYALTGIGVQANA